jgi:cellulose synthase/poly-beta-1,6-N-acetylglucosamine synthase-like glycosyltransferase
VLDEYFSLAYAQSHEVGLLKANLKLAEDRIISHLSVICSGQYSHYVDAVFYFEAELEWNKLLAQRRRWSNGTFAGHGYVMSEFPRVLSSTFNPLFKLAFTCMVAVQWSAHFISLLAVSTFGISFVSHVGLVCNDTLGSPSSS